MDELPSQSTSYHLNFEMAIARYDNKSNFDGSKIISSEVRGVTTGGTLSSGLRDIFACFCLREILLTPWDFITTTQVATFITLEPTSPDSALLRDEPS